jgi:alpha-beta hydrolase superfamily lysophospholipase
MTFIEETVSAADGLRLYIRRHAGEHARGEVIIVHGFGEHSGRYGALTDHLVRNRYSVTAYDHRGHGLSDGLPGHVDQFDEYEDDLDKVVGSVRARGQNRNLFLIGHSMGGLVSLRYLAEKNSGIAAGVISAPLIELAVQAPAHKMMIARVGARVAPRMRLGNEIDPAVLSRDPSVGAAYAADPLVNRVVSPRWFTEAKRAMEEVKERASRITVPLLVLHGTQDKLASVEATRRLFEHLGATDKQLGIYQGYYHELFNEPEKQEIFDRVVQWLDAHNSA